MGSINYKRNIGISAHIDSGKTTLTERMLFYCNKIRNMHEVRGRDGVGATMDWMELERERGITICSATTNVEWREHSIDVIDTPGHVDFTIEVERALRVLDGAVLVLCAIGGVQSQTLTVTRQLNRYRVPRIAFINKMDRPGADPIRVAEQVRAQLGLQAVLLQLPIGREDSFCGVVDLVSMKAVYFDGPYGQELRVTDIPDEMYDEARKRRSELVDAASLYCDELAEAFLEDRESEEQLRAAIRKGVISGKLMPVLMGTAYKNKGVQPLLDAVVDFLPCPLDVEATARDLDNNGNEIVLDADPAKRTVAYAFKLEDGPYGQLTYIRVYQGTVTKGDDLVNARSRNRVRIGRLIRMHADSMEDITAAGPGDIVGLFGIDCVSGDTFTAPGHNISMTAMHVPPPVISLALKPKDRTAADNMAKALGRFIREDPTFHSFVDPESNETVIRGMGELHLDVYVERMRREYDVDLETGMPQVAYRESISRRVEFDYTHKKQTGGAGQYGRVCGFIEPAHEIEYEFVNEVKGGTIPSEYIPSCDKGFKACLTRGSLLRYPILGIRVTVNDGNYHPVDSSDIAFQQAAIGAFRQAYEKAGPHLLEPVMKLSVEGPSEFGGNILGSIHQRRGLIISTLEDGARMRVDAQVPLAEMFGYSTLLRSQTQGKAEFTMEFEKYLKVPPQIAQRIIEENSARAQSQQKDNRRGTR